MNAVIIYDEFTLAANANVILEAALHHADETAIWNINPWRLDLLTIPPTDQAALKDVAQAHLIVLAIRNETTLINWLLDWLELWADSRQVRNAALAVWDGGNGGRFPSTANRELSELAKRHGVSFISEAGKPVEVEDASGAFARNLHEREIAITPTLQHILELPGHRAHVDWGINE